MVQVTIEWEGAEIGYGEAELEADATVYAFENLDGIYADVPHDELKVTVVRS